MNGKNSIVKLLKWLNEEYEILNEGKFNKSAMLGKIGKGTQSTAQPNTAAQASNTPAQNSANGPSSDTGWTPSVGHCFISTDDDGTKIYRLRLNYILGQDISLLQKLSQKYNDVFKAVAIRNSNNSAEFLIPEQKIDEFKKLIPNVVELLKRLSRNRNKNIQYNTTVLDNLEKDILRSLKETPTDEELKAYQDSLAQNWRELQTKINDPSVQAKLRNLSVITVNKYGEFENIDHLLSARNKMIILSQDPNATYVTSEEGWERLNREILDYSKYILVISPSHKTIDAATKDAIARKLGYASYKTDYLKRKHAGLLSGGQIHKFNMAAEYASTDSHFSFMKKMYDVANTKVIDGAVDIFNNEARFKNNLLGIPNDVAQNNKDAMDAQIKAFKDAHPEISADTETTTARTEAMLSNSVFVLARACREIGINFIESGNLSEDIGEATYQYELKKARSVYHIPKPDGQKLFALSIAAAVSQSLGLSNNKIIELVNSHGTLSDAECQDAWGEFAGITSALSSKAGLETGLANIKAMKFIAEEKINEMGGINSYDDFKNLLTRMGVSISSPENSAIQEEVMDEFTSEELSESFFKMLDRIE